MGDSINTVSHDVDIQKKYSATLDQALTAAGVGWYNLKYCFVLSLFLIASVLESAGYGFVMPAAVCDLNISDSQRGIIYSIPFIGIVLMSFQWGYLVDTKGRKKVLICSSLGAGVFGTASGFMPDLISFAICKFLTALCIGCPLVVPYSYVAEILPREHRDLALAVTTTIQILGSVLVPLLAWAILSLDFSINFGAYLFRPWRLLVIIYATLFLIAAGLLSYGPESPKYLVAEGKNDDALKVVQDIYSGNTKKQPEDYPIKRLEEGLDNRKRETFLTSLKVQSLPLLKPPYLKWMILNAFLLFGVYSVLSGLFAWVPDILNRLLLDDGEGQTACDAFDGLNQTISDDDDCNDSIDQITFVISSIADFSSFVIAILIGSTVKFIDKKILLILVFIVVGGLCILINFVTEAIPFALLLPPIQAMSLAVGLVTAFSVDIFPVSLRGMAVGLTMTGAAMGSIFGSNVAAFLLNAACEVTFYSFGGLLILLAWAILSLDFSINFGAYLFRPWRLLVIIYATLFLIAAGLLSYGPESPKYLVAEGKNDDALKVVQDIYSGNTKKQPEDYPIKRLEEGLDNRKRETFLTSLKVQSLPLLKPPYLKWMILNAFLLFGVYSVLSGLFAWVPDILNRLLLDDGEGQTACDAFDGLNQTISDDDDCNDSIDQITFVISSIADFSSFVIAILIGSTVKFIDKKILLILVFIVVGGLCILINFVTEAIPFALLLPPIQAMSLAVGLVTAFSVDIFPVSLRGMAVGLTMTGAAMGSIFGSNVAAFLLNAACEVTFYSFGGLLILCGLLCILLPNSKESLKN